MMACIYWIHIGRDYQSENIITGSTVAMMIADDNCDHDHDNVNDEDDDDYID